MIKKAIAKDLSFLAPNDTPVGLQEAGKWMPNVWKPRPKLGFLESTQLFPSVFKLLRFRL